jgi:DNA helicase-2/ATP-dependent DNA helicase PcrA
VNDKLIEEHEPQTLSNNTEECHPLLRDLNAVQREAVQHCDGPILLFAGAGSGKTRVLTRRVAYLIQERHVSPYNILAVTFTNKAATEMKERIGQLIGWERRQSLLVGTFHSTCARLLREHGHKIGIEKDFLVYDDGDQMTLMRQVMRALNIDPESYAPRAILSHISRAKEKMITPETWKLHFFGHFDDVCGKLYPEYQDRLRQNNALDFDDLLTETVRLLTERQDVLDRLQDRFRYILVDEYQDVNYVQYLLLKLLAERHRNICVVGDDDQSIYLFRGADVELILKFETDYPEARVLKLEQNYRSTQTILDAAHAVISNNVKRKEKQLWTEKDRGEPLVLREAENEQEEAIWIVQRIREDRQRKQRRLSDYTILYRTNAQSRALEEVFVNWNTPYRIIGGLRFYERKEIKDVLAYLRVVNSPQDSISLQRIINVPARGIGATSLTVLEQEKNRTGKTLWDVLQNVDEITSLQVRTRRRLAEFVSLIASFRADRDKLGVTDLAERVLERSGYKEELEQERTIEAETRLENIGELLSKTKQYEKETESPNLTGFLENVSLVADIDSLDASADAVTLMTLHSAKGLEFPVVFLAGMEEGLFPHSRALNDDTKRELEEERRLCYVGITRAETELCITYARKRTVFGRVMYSKPSRFITELPRELFGGSKREAVRGPVVSGFDPDEDDRPVHRQPTKLWVSGPISPREQIRATHASGIKTGNKVRHSAFGLGVVLNVTGEGDATIVEVVFANYGPKKIALAYAKLDIVK